MAREFTMGARINLNTGSYSNGMSSAIRATQNFSEEIVDLDRAMGRYYDSNGRLREANGRFAASAGTVTRQLETQAGAATSLKDKLMGVHGVLVGLAGVVAGRGLYDWLIESNAQMEQYQNTLSVVLGSQEKAVKTLEWANKFAAQTPFEIPQIVEATTVMSSYGMNAQETMGIVGDMASVMGKDLMQAVEAVADAQTGELERLKEFGITKKMLEEQAALMGKTPFDSKGSLKDQEALNATLFAIMEDRFKGGMEIQSKSFKGMLSNASDFIGGIGRKLGKPLFDNLKNTFGGLLDWLNQLQASGAVDAWIAKVHKAGSVMKQVFQTAGGIIATVFNAIKGPATELFTYLKSNFQTLKPYIIGVASAFLIYFTYLKLINTWTKIVAAAQAAWNAVMAMNPVILIVLAIGLLIGYLIHLAGGWDVVKAKLISFLPALQRLWQTIVTAVMPILRKLGQLALQIFTKFKTVILPVITGFIRDVVAGFLSLVNWIRTHWESISMIIQVVWAFIVGYVSSVIGFLQTIIVGGFSFIASAVSNVWKMIQGVIQIAWSIISGLIGAGLAILRGDWQAAWDSMLGILSGVWEGIKKFFGGLKDLFFESGKKLLTTLADGIKAAAMAPVNAIKGAFKKVREFLPFSDAHEGPLSQLTHNGGKIVTTMADGINKQKGALTAAMDNVLGNTPGVNIEAGKVNPAGSTAGGGNISKTVIIEKLIEKLEISGAEGKNAKELALEVIAELYEILKGAKEIESAGLGDLL